MKVKNIFFAVGAVSLLTACGVTNSPSANETREAADKAIASSWQNVQPGWEKRLVQDETQKVCTAARDKPSKAESENIEKLNQAMKVSYPADGKLMGDWNKGESIAQSGYGMRIGDNATGREPGGNCYACHQMQMKELSYGTLGPSLYQYGKLRGDSEAIVKYTYDKIYNAQAFLACSNMPRFGHNAILTPTQISHLVGLLVDPKSPVNQ